MTLPPDMVLFDCDGVLVDSEPLTSGVLCRSLQRHGLAVTPHQLADMFLGGTLMGVAETSRAMGAQLPDSWVEDTYEEIFDVLGARVKAVPGVYDLLDRLDTAGVPYAVCSNGPHRKMRITLGRTGLSDRLAGRTYSREDVLKPKPAPDVYLKAAADSGKAPERCVVIEDSVNGARAGQAAGMQIFGFVADTPAAKLSPHCHDVFDAMGDLPALLRI